MRVLLLLILAFASPAAAQEAPAVVRGFVVDSEGAPVPFANVQVIGTLTGAATDADGRFLFATDLRGPHTVQATMVGFDPATAAVVLAPGGTTSLRLVLRETLITLDEAVVTADAYTTGDDEVATLGALEVVTTPGAAADVFRAVKAFPGVALVDEGAGLFVRGGDVSETVVLLDGATVAHPYKYETPTGGVFGTISPFLVARTAFSTGAFSARYGNALSGILAMESQEAPLQRETTLNVGLAAASLGLNLPITERVGLRLSGNRSFTGLLFRVNGQHDDFTRTPQGYDGTLSLTYRYRPTGRLKLFAFGNRDQVGVHVAEPSFGGVYRGETTSSLHVLSWSEVWRGWFVEGSLSLSRYTSHQRLGLLDFRPSDRLLKLRWDAERPLGARVQLALGTEAERATNTYRGTVPVSGGVLDPGAASIALDEHYAARRLGGYAEVALQPHRRVVLTAGLRADHHAPARQAVLDPRLAFRYALSEATSLRLAGGLYHQFAEPYAYNAASGNPRLRAQVARHLVGGLEHARGLTLVRVEAYRKPYRRLLLRHPTLNLTTDGEGLAQGVDVFAKYSTFMRTRVSGWIAYSRLRSERLQARDLGRAVAFERGPAPYDITHNLTLVGKVRIWRMLSGGLTFRHATGRPMTPVVDAVPVDGGAYHLPIDGPVGSERLPSFQRLDLQVLYYVPFGRRHNAVLYLAVNNVLDRANVVGWAYSPDYATRTDETTDYRRFLYAGITLTLAP